MLCSAVRCLSAIPNPYERLARRITAEASKSLNCALSLSAAAAAAALASSAMWSPSPPAPPTSARPSPSSRPPSATSTRLLSVYSSDDPFDGGGAGGLIFSLPPMASTNPILSWVWSCIAAVHMAARPSDRAKAATSLTNLALDSGRNKKIIIEEGGVPSLLALLRDGAASMDAQIAAATTLSNLAADRELVFLIVSDLAVPIVIQVLNDASIQLQALLGLAWLARRAVPCLARHDRIYEAVPGTVQLVLG